MAKMRGRRRSSSEPTDQAAKAGLSLSEARAGKLRVYVEELERIDEDRRHLAQQKSELMADAAADDFNRKALKVVLAKRKLGLERAQELEDVVAQYELALGMTPLEQEIERSRGREVDLGHTQPAGMA